MATTIQLLRSDIAQTRPDPGVLANGTPMVNLHESEPGLFFAARDGSLFKIGPAAIGPLPPNELSQGHPGNALGELWLDSSAAKPILRIYDGADWVACIQDVGGTVTSVGVSFDGIFNVEGSPVTSSGVITATLEEQQAGDVFAGPVSGSDSPPTFRPLVATDIPIIPGEKISSFSSVVLRDSTGNTLTLAAPNVTTPYALNLPSSDGTNGAVLVTNGGGQLSFETSLFGLASIGGAADLALNAGGANGNVVLAPTGAGVISASASRLTDLSLPVNATDAASKAYVDTFASGLQPKAQVETATTANINLSTAGLSTIDTVTLSVGDRVLVKDQSLPEQNGIYEATLGAWVRTPDADDFSELVGATVFVAGGSVNIGKTFLCDSPAGGTIDVNPVDWVVFSSGVGTVTSVGLSMPSPFTVAGSPITTSGTLAVTLNTQTANRVFAGPPSGGAGAPTFRALVSSDIPTSLNAHTFTGITPDVDATRNLGSPSLRWANIYSADLNLSNEGSTNDVDGTWGSYTIQEGEDDLYLINRRSGKRYKFLLQEV
jgi:hypothetical protein